MQEIKYTSDGKKVAVLGKLNSQETIVQEIFIVNGQEIPSGENFVVKSLHDAPAISWKEKKLQELEKTYDNDSKEWLSRTDRLQKEYHEKSKLLKAKINYIGLALKNADEKSFDLLVDFITGEVKWVVANICDYGDPKLVRVEEFESLSEYANTKMRLISLFGNDDGTLTYAQGRYSDGSGGQVDFKPFKKYEDALAHFKELILERGVSGERLEIAKKYGFEFPSEKVQEWKDEKIAYHQKRILEYEEYISNNMYAIETLRNGE